MYVLVLLKCILYETELFTYKLSCNNNNLQYYSEQSIYFHQRINVLVLPIHIAVRSSGSLALDQSYLNKKTDRYQLLVIFIVHCM